MYQGGKEKMSWPDFACASAAQTLHREKRFGAQSRDEIRRLSVIEALDLLREAMQDA